MESKKRKTKSSSRRSKGRSPFSPVSSGQSSRSGPKSQRKSNRVRTSGPNSGQRSTNQTRLNGYFIEALRGEAFGPHPGLADVRLKLYLYNSIAKREIRLPDKQIDLLIGSPGEVDELLKVIRKAIEDWVRGYTTV